MNEILREAREELKRADHLYYVSLKYSRMVDVIKNLIDRLISALERAIEAMLLDAEGKNLILERPSNIGLKVDLLRKTVDAAWVEDMLNFFVLLRKINRAEFTRSREFRRHVTMTAMMEDRIIEVNLDVSKEYLEKTVRFVDLAEEYINGKATEE